MLKPSNSSRPGDTRAREAIKAQSRDDLDGQISLRIVQRAFQFLTSASRLFQIAGRRARRCKR